MLLHRLIAIALVALSFLPMPAKKSDPSTVVMTIAGKDVTLGEFEYLYHKNSSQQIEPVTLEQYVDMFVNYKLKVAAAEAAGIDTTASFLKEYNGYRDEIAAPYMTDRLMADSLREAAISHFATNVDVSHIMLAPDASPAYVDSIYRALLAGADFAATAAELSADRLSAPRGGSLGFISAGRYPYAFEDAAYNTPAGSISAPVASHAGIHIIKVNARRPDRGQVQVRHILKLTRGADAATVAAKRAAIDSIAALLASGADFAALAAAESDDPTGHSGGVLPWFGAGVMVPPFEEAAFALAPGETSPVVETAFGFHIIRCDSCRDSEPADEIEARVRSIMESDGRAALPRHRFLDTFRASRPHLAAASYDAVAAAALEELPSLYPDLRHLLNEYRDGMLLYEMSNREIWSRPAADPEGLRAFFESHRDRYTFDRPCYKGYVIVATADSLAADARDFLAAATDTAPPARFPALLRSRYGSSVRIERVLAAKGDNPIIDHLVWDAPAPPVTGKWTSHIPFAGHVIDRPEEAADVSAAVTADWQQSLEEAWIARLRDRFTVTVNRKLLHRLR